jgi:hypothetical protein
MLTLQIVEIFSRAADELADTCKHILLSDVSFVDLVLQFIGSLHNGYVTKHAFI